MGLVGDKIVTPLLTPPYGVVHWAKNMYTLQPSASGGQNSVVQMAGSSTG